MLKVSINHIPDFINLAVKSKNNILIVGNPGVGKSQVLESMRSEKVNLVTMTGSSTIEEYVNGIPQVEGEGMKKVLEYISPKWFQEMEEWNEKEEHKGGYQILFLDEFNTADPQVLKTFLTILAERRIPTLNKSLPDNVVLVAAMNPNDQNDTEKLIRPMASRFMVLQAESTIETYRRFLSGTESQSILSKEKMDDVVELTVAQKTAILAQIAETDWNKYDSKDDNQYHEINPRSMSAFFRALEVVKDRKFLTPRLSQAFIGKKVSWVENAEAVAEERAKKMKDGKILPTAEELEGMTTEALQDYLEQLSASNTQDNSKRACRLNIMEILEKRQTEEVA